MIALKTYKRSVADLFYALPSVHCATEGPVVDEGGWQCRGCVERRSYPRRGVHVAVPTGSRVRFEGIEVLHIKDGRTA